MYTEKLLKQLRLCEPKWVWKVPALPAMTDEVLIQELQRRGYVIKREQKAEDVNGLESGRT